MSNIQLVKQIDYCEQRVLTTKQLAEFYGCEIRAIGDNFNRHQDRFVEGKHYFFLEGDDLKRFLEGSPLIAGNLKYTPKLYLWTEKGAARHAKILSTEKAWDVFEELEDTYFRVKEIEKALPQSPLQLEQMIAAIVNPTLQAMASELYTNIMEYVREKVAAERDYLFKLSMDNLKEAYRDAEVKHNRAIQYANDLEETTASWLCSLTHDVYAHKEQIEERFGDFEAQLQALTEAAEAHSRTAKSSATPNNVVSQPMRRRMGGVEPYLPVVVPEGYMSVRTFSVKYGLDFDLTQSQEFGKRATQHCISAGILMYNVPINHAEYMSVHLYPEAVLLELYTQPI